VWVAALLAAHAETAPDAIELVEALMDATAAGGPTEAWLSEHVAAGEDPSEDRVGVWSRALAVDRRTRALIASRPRLLDVSEAPTYDRVVLETSPRLSVLIVRDPLGAPKLDRIEPTTCAPCTEPRRFVEDLLADVGRGAAFPRLSPGVELYVDAWLRESPEALEARWVGAYVSIRPASWLAEALRGARVVHADGDVVDVGWPNGRQESWTIRFERDHYAVDYGSLPAESVLRLPLAAVLSWRDVEETPLRAVFEPSSDGVVLATGVGAMALDLRDETVVVASFAKDGSGTAARLDPATDDLRDAVSLPGHERAPTETWRGPGPTVSVRPDGWTVTHEGRILSLTGEQIDVSVVRTPMPTPSRPSRDDPAWDPTDQFQAFLEGGTLFVGFGGEPVARLTDVVDVAWAWDGAHLVALEKGGALRWIAARRRDGT
jgi:hypothetical protein